MSGIGKYISLCLVVILAVSSLLMVKPIDAQTIPKPSVPKFTLNIVDGSLLIEIQNQPIIPNGHDTAGIFYDFRYKWHESANWNHPEPDPTQWRRQYIAEIGTTGITQLADSPDSFYIKLGDSNSHELDYQIRAINGYQNTTYPWVPPIGIEPGDNPIIVVSTSDWSITQTISIPDGSVSISTSPNPTQTPSPSPTVPEFSITVSLVAVLAAVSLLLVIGKRKLTIINH